MERARAQLFPHQSGSLGASSVLRSGPVSNYSAHSMIKMIRMHFSQTQLYKDCWFILVLLFIIVASLAYLRSYQERTYQVNFCCEILVHVFFKTYIRLCSLIFGRSTHDPSCFGSSEAVSEAEAWKKQVGKQPGHAN